MLGRATLEPICRLSAVRPVTAAQSRRRDTSINAQWDGRRLAERPAVISGASGVRQSAMRSRSRWPGSNRRANAGLRSPVMHGGIVSVQCALACLALRHGAFYPPFRRRRRGRACLSRSAVSSSPAWDTAR